MACVCVVLGARPHRESVYDFQKSSFGSSPGVYNETHALYVGRIVSVAYCAKLHVENWTCPPCEYVSKLPDLVVINDAKEAFQGILGFTGTHVVVAFRGSMDVRNWIDNLSFLKTHPWPNMPKVAVHLGFHWVYQSIRDQLIVALEGLFILHPNAPLLVTGHSLGAAVAAIAVLDLHTSQNMTTSEMLTFGEPRVGNAAFVTKLLQVVPHVHRVTHWRDVVPHIPLEWQGFVHEPQEVWYTEDSSAFKLCDPHSGEDPLCSKQVPTIGSFADHVVYLNITMSHLVC
ncbi:hypothetical protein DYB32_008204 [Aphanomyces invadans]|nr:hypothetical protein DYB32_008204 [Aphanomyces invadans]